MPVPVGTEAPPGPFRAADALPASPVPETSPCRSGRGAREGHWCLAVTLSRGHVPGPPASRFPSPRPFGAEPHGALEPQCRAAGGSV